ncbi:MAG: RNA polymerase sigma-70 factor [Bacteroidales bacterium]|nr:RNA polymerase sigma-70 factor [Bacteroidales bacterium]
MSKVQQNISLLFEENAEKAFELLYKQYYKQLNLYAIKFLDDVHLAEDVVQNTLIKIWNRVDELKEIKSYKAYLFQAVHNACINAMRDKNYKNASLSEIDLELLEIANDVADVDNEKIEQIKSVVASLPTQCKKIFELNRFEGYSYKEIAQKLNISHRTVDSHLNSAMKHLREKLNPVFIFIILIFLVK